MVLLLPDIFTFSPRLFGVEERFINTFLRGFHLFWLLEEGELCEIQS